MGIKVKGNWKARKFPTYLNLQMGRFRILNIFQRLFKIIRKANIKI
jgi:hypothetical protein